MANVKDRIPNRDADFDGWLENFKNGVVEKTSGSPPEWTHIPAEKTSALVTHYTAWNSAYKKTLAPHTPVETAAKNDRKTEAKAFVRPFIDQYLMFDPVTNEDRLSLGIHNRDHHPTPIGKPKTRALIVALKALGGFQVEIRFQDETTPSSRAVPYGCNGCLLHYTWGPEKVTDHAALMQTQLMTRSPWVMNLPPEAEGKFFSGVTCWQSDRSELGPPGEILSVVIA
ncbi:MAG: hypothetical protein LBJ41_08705 [Treponema sp.]|jgi:hypothetical protein|nr:hypothetical protein [Treponema sp.]